jgi:phage terminase small subunit
MPLTDKQIRFCEEYLIDLNATQAAIRSGYSEKTAGQIGEQNLKKLEIQSKISELQKARSQRTEITADRVLMELAAIGFANISDYVEVAEQDVKVDTEDGKQSTIKVKGVDVFKTKDVGRDKMRAVAEIRQTRDGISLKMHDKVKALEDMGKHLGIFEEDNKQKAPVINWNEVLTVKDGSK